MVFNASNNISVKCTRKRIRAKGIACIVYEPMLHRESFLNSKVMNDLDAFKNNSDIIVANRWNEELEDVCEKVYTRDMFFRD